MIPVDGHPPCVVVAGMGRCGTSLLMQMLDAAGIECVGKRPDYETPESFGNFRADVFARMRGRAIKLVDPMRLPIDEMPNHIVLWLDRDFREQAKSALKLLSVFENGVRRDRQAVRAMERSLRSDRPKNMKAVGASGRCPTLILTFEDILSGPAATARLVKFLATHGYPRISAEQMASQIRRRSPKCLPGLMEAQLLYETGVNQ